MQTLVRLCPAQDFGNPLDLLCCLFAVYFPFQSFDGAGPFLLGGPLNRGARRNKSVGGEVDGRRELLA